MYEYWADVVRVVDGDTVDVMLDLGFGVKKKERLRLAGINAPETRTRDKLEKSKGLAAKDWLIDILNKENNRIMVATGKEKGKFGRYIAVLHQDMANDEYKAKGGHMFVSINKLMVQKGHAVEKEY